MALQGKVSQPVARKGGKKPLQTFPQSTSFLLRWEIIRHTLAHSFLKWGTNRASVSKKSPSYQDGLHSDCLAHRAVSRNNTCDLTSVGVVYFSKPIVSESGKMHSSVSLPSKLWHHVQQDKQVVNTHTSFQTFNPEVILNMENKLTDSELHFAKVFNCMSR